MNKFSTKDDTLGLLGTEHLQCKDLQSYLPIENTSTSKGQILVSNHNILQSGNVIEIICAVIFNYAN